MNATVLSWAQLAVMLVAGVGGVSAVVQLLRVRVERDKIRADAANVTSEAAARIAGMSAQMLQPFEARAGQLEERAATLQRRVHELEDIVETLKDTLAEERRLSRREINRLTAELSESETENARLRGSQRGGHA